MSVYEHFSLDAYTGSRPKELNKSRILLLGLIN